MNKTHTEEKPTFSQTHNFSFKSMTDVRNNRVESVHCEDPRIEHNRYQDRSKNFSFHACYSYWKLRFFKARFLRFVLHRTINARYVVTYMTIMRLVEKYTWDPYNDTTCSFVKRCQRTLGYNDELRFISGKMHRSRHGITYSIIGRNLIHERLKRTGQKNQRTKRINLHKHFRKFVIENSPLEILIGCA